MIGIEFMVLGLSLAAAMKNKRNGAYIGCLSFLLLYAADFTTLISGPQWKFVTDTTVFVVLICIVVLTARFMAEKSSVK